MHVLVVHSDPRFYREMKLLIADEEATGAYQPGLNGIQFQIEAHAPDLIVLEQRCLSAGSEALANAFPHSQRLPVIFLTAADCERIRVGDERSRLVSMLNYVRSQTERAKSLQVMQVGKLRIHAGRMRVAVEDRWVRLPPIQFRILHYLALNANETVTHRELMSTVWGFDATDDEARDLLKVHITQLRRKLGPEFRDYIQAVRGQGYVFVDPDADD
jgi:DNA-binding response OmpR family regulator